MQQQDHGTGASQHNVSAQIHDHETTKMRGHLRIGKYDEHGNLYGTVEDENIFLTVGTTEILKLMTGQSANTFTNAQAEIGVGDSTTAAAAAQTDLQAPTNKTYKAMNAGYPSVPSAGSVQFQATFASADANYAWNEFVVKQLTSAICLDRAVGTWGTKASGTSWNATLTLSMS